MSQASPQINITQSDPASWSLHSRTLIHPLSDAQLADYRQKGYIVLRNVFTPDEVESWKAEGERLYNRPDLIDPDNLRFDWSKTDDGTPVRWKIDPFHDLSELFHRLVYDRRILDPLASIYEGREARLFKDKFIFKPARSQGNGLHQDYNWWQGFPESLLSVMIAVDAADEENGCTELFSPDPGRLLTPAGTFAMPGDHILGDHVGEKVITQPGDVAIFGCYVLHRAGPNRSDRSRRQLFISYNDSRDGEFYHAHYQHFFWYRTVQMTPEERARKYFDGYDGIRG